MALEQVAPELAKFAQFGNVAKQAPVVDQNALNNPLFSMKPAAIAEWSVATKGDFSPKAFYAANRDTVRQNPEVYQKLVQAHKILGERGFEVKDIDLGKAFKGVGHVLKGLAEAGGAYSEQFDRKGFMLSTVNAPISATQEFVEGKAEGRSTKESLLRAGERVLPRKVFRKLFKQDTPEQKEALDNFLNTIDQEQRQKEAEIIAGSEAAATGTFDLGRRGARKLFGKDWGDLSDAEATERFELDAGVLAQQAASTAGKGAVTETVFGGEAEKIVRPEKVESLAAGDPLSFLAFSGGADLATGGIKAVVGGAVRRLPAVQRVAAAEAAGSRAAQATSVASAAESRAAQAATQAGQRATAAAEAGTPEALAAAEGATERALAAQGEANAARAVQGEAVGQAGRAAETALASPTSRAVIAGQNAIRNLRAKVTSVAQQAAPRAGQVAAGTGVATIGAAIESAGLGIDFVRSFLAPIITPRALKVTAGGLRRVGGNLRRSGTNIALGREGELGLVGQFVSDVAGAGGDVAGGAAKGFVPDLAFAALTSEEPADTAHMPLFMTTIGGLRGGVRGGARVLSGQLAAPRNQRMVRAEFGSAGRRNYGSHPALDQGHQFSIRNADPRVVQRLGAIRSVVEQFGGEAYLIEDPQVFQSALRSLGLSQERAQFISEQLGVRLDLPDAQGNVRPVIIMREVGAGPHEAGHAMQFFLSEEANNVLRQGAMDQFANEWDARGQAYAARLEGQPAIRPDQSWQQILVERTGGLPEGQDFTARANRLLADEIIAENFDAIMEARGPELGSSKFQDVIMGTLRTLGLDNVEIARSKEQNIPVTPKSFELVRQAGELARTEAARPRFAGEGQPLRTGGIRRTVYVEPRQAPTTPQTPEERATAEQEARDIAGQLETPDQQAIISTVADAIGDQTAVSIAYRAAPGEPAGAPGSSRAQRRAVIEAFRQMPESARRLWERSFFPERVVQTGKGPQVIGWSPEVVAANAQKLAKTLSDMSRRGVDIRQLSPYEIDVQRGTFTEAGWNKLFEDAQTFSQNQMRGRTGAGEELVVPRSAQERGAFAPEVTGEGSPLPQETADFHNALFNFRLPGTPRITGRNTPLNILGQEVAEATLPGRVQPPVEPRAPFAGERARELGIEGREIQEVNPLRNRITREAQNVGLKYPSMIEAIQRLNIDRIAEVEANPLQAPFGRGNTLTLTAGFQAKRKGAAGTVEALRETPRVGYGKHVWLDKDGHYYDADGFHKEWAEKFTGIKGDESMQKMFDDGWVRVNATPGIGIFAEGKPGQAMKTPQIRALEDFAFNAELPVLNRKGRVAINSTAEFQRDTGFAAFQARRSPAKQWELKKASGGERTSKGWILPNGDPAMLGGQWHHDYLARNSADLSKRFKMDTKALKGGEDASRKEALKKGAVRISYSTGTGNLVIEATRKGWNRNKAALERFALENIDKINSVDISIFDPQIRKEVDYDSAQLFRYGGPEKLQNFPMLFEEARNSAVGGARERIGGLFQPAKNRDVESIRAAAVRWKPTGKVYEGMMHALASEKILAEGLADDLLGRPVRSFDELADSGLWNKFIEQVDDGYSTTDRPFVTRAEAVEIGDRAGQLDNRAKAKIKIREERFGERTLDSAEVTPLREQQMAAEAGGEVSGETIGRAHGDPTVQAQPQPLVEKRR